MAQRIYKRWYLEADELRHENQMLDFTAMEKLVFTCVRVGACNRWLSRSPSRVFRRSCNPAFGRWAADPDLDLDDGASGTDD